jgi:hypothetical protein
MDPRTGRFASIDPHPGVARRPTTLHDYTYANNNPISSRDPTGKMSMADVGAGLAIGAALAGAAMHAYTTFQGQTSSAKTTKPLRPFTLWDAVVATMARSVVYKARAKAADPEDHHTVPIYLCGSTDQRTSRIRWDEHKGIHFGLGLLYIGVISAETLADQLVPIARRRTGQIMKFAETEGGREVIAGLIGDFYDASGYGAVGSPPIDEVFNGTKTFIGEREQYIKGKTSLPACQR